MRYALLEYAVVAGGLLGSNLDFLFNLDPTQEVVVAVIWGIVLISLGYLIKGFWGAVVALFIGFTGSLLFHLYIKVVAR
jgi:hypothetical protein